MAFYSVSSVSELQNIIIPHFLKYNLLTQKAADFLLFCKVVELINSKAHLSIEGLHQIINIKVSMNTGRFKNLLDFSNIQIKPVERPLINTSAIPDPKWVSGFVNGEGTFDVKIYSSKTKVGHAVQLRFRVPQHERDTKLIEILKSYFESGSLEKHTVAKLSCYNVQCY